MLLKMQSKAGKSKPWSCTCPVELGFSHIQTEFKHNGLSAQNAAHILLCYFNSYCPCNLILINCTYHMSIYTHEQVMLPWLKSKDWYLQVSLEATSSKTNSCPGQQRGRIKEVSWGRHLSCLYPFYPSDGDYKASETQIYLLETKLQM